MFRSYIWIILKIYNHLHKQWFKMGNSALKNNKLRAYFTISNGVSWSNVPPVLAKSTGTENWQSSLFFRTNIIAEQKTYWGDWVCVKIVANDSIKHPYVILWARSSSAKFVFYFHGLLHTLLHLSIATFVEYCLTQNKNYSSLGTITYQKLCFPLIYLAFSVLG